MKERQATFFLICLHHLRRIYFLLFYFFLLSAHSQIDNGLVGRFLFDGNSKDIISGEFARAVGSYYTDDRFGNSKSAYFIPGNHTDYINLGNGARLKVTRGTISLWVSISQGVHGGNGALHNPVMMTRSHAVENCNEVFFIGYHLDLRSLNVCTALSEERQVIKMLFSQNLKCLALPKGALF